MPAPIPAIETSATRVATEGESARKCGRPGEGRDRSVVPLLRNGSEARGALGRGEEEWLGARPLDAVSALQLGAVDGEVGLVDELVRVDAVLGEARHAEGDGRADGLARRLHLEAAVGHRAPNPLGDLEGDVRGRLREEDGKLLAAETCRDVVVAQLRAEDVGDPLQYRVAREVAVGVVDVPEEVQVGHDDRQRPLHPGRAQELLAKLAGEVAGVEEAGLRVDAGLLLERRDAQRAVDQEERGDGGRQEPRVPGPDGREGDAEGREHEVGRETLCGEETGLAEGVAARVMEHRRKENVVEAHEDDRCREAREREREVGVETELPDQVRRPPRREPVEGVVRDVEPLDVPRVANLQPFRHVLDDAHEGDELGRQEERGRDQEDDRRVVALVPGRADDEELRHRCAGGEDEEGRPAVRGGLQMGERDERDRDCDCRHGEEVGLRLAGEHPLRRFRAGAPVDRREFGRNDAHLTVSMRTPCAKSAPFHAEAWAAEP
jgi:hypothetical protein